jgi:hypothetical protein
VERIILCRRDDAAEIVALPRKAGEFIPNGGKRRIALDPELVLDKKVLDRDVSRQRLGKKVL